MHYNDFVPSVNEAVLIIKTLSGNSKEVTQQKNYGCCKTNQPEDQFESPN